MAPPIRRVTPSLVIADQAFQVISWELDERLDEPSTLRCDLSLGDAALPRPGTLVDERAHFSLTRDDDQVRRFHGLVVAAEVLPDDDDVPYLRVEVAPSLWELDQRADCRIFQEKSAVDIVKAVLEGAGIDAAKQEWRLGEDHPVRTYTAQYRETDLCFVRRLLFEEGIHFAIHATEEDGKIVFGDAPEGLGDVEGEAKLEFHPEFGHEIAADVVRNVERVSVVRSDKTYTRDYDPERPRLDLSGGAEGNDPGEHGLEVYDWPARSHEPEVAARRAKVLLESMQAERDVIRAETGSLALWPGL
ncbi:MAG: contractile injection system protein, VgrG/Pvc8 family, partial [Polyangiaceae bacterium]